MIYLFDSHAHYDDKAFDEDRDHIIDAVHREDVEYIINVGSNIRSSEKSVELSKKYNFIYAAIGVHPHDVGKAPLDYLDKLRILAKNEKVVAIGEIGLDYHYDFSPRGVQKKCLTEQIALARELGLPIIVHDREAHEDTLKILREERVGEVGGVMHCFSGSYEMAKEIVNLGLHIGIGGTVTFTNAQKTVEVVEKIPLEYIFSETDCPYLTPVPNRGKRNDSRYMRYTIEKIAELKRLNFDNVSNILAENTKKVFRII